MSYCASALRCSGNAAVRMALAEKTSSPADPFSAVTDQVF
jgi:hypothetical protein